jgi:hypothetical protein
VPIVAEPPALVVVVVVLPGPLVAPPLPLVVDGVPPESDCEHAAHPAKQAAPIVPIKAHRGDESIFMGCLLV